MVSKYSLEIGNLLCKLSLVELFTSQDCHSPLSKNCLLPFEKKSCYTAVLQLWCCVSENVWGCRLARQRLRRRWWCWGWWLGRWLSPLMMMMIVIILKMETVWAWHVTWGRVRDQKGRKLQRHEPPPYKGAPDPFVQFFQHRVFIHNFISFSLSAKLHDFQ